jgi:hypothetical protein
VAACRRRYSDRVNVGGRSKVYTADDCAADAQYRHRGMDRELEDPLFGTVLHTGVEGRITWCSSCRYRKHTTAVMCGAVPKIVDARCGMAAAGTPLQRGSQKLKRVLDAASRRRSAIVEDEECFGVGGKRFPIAPLVKC